MLNYDVWNIAEILRNHEFSVTTLRAADTPAPQDGILHWHQVSDNRNSLHCRENKGPMTAQGSNRTAEMV